MRKRVMTVLAILGAVAFAQLGGCYYMQAVGGQLELMRKREPIEDVLARPGLPADTRQKLELVLDARRFAVTELGLPDNGSYQSYADLERDFVVWNVFAAPEFALEPVEWCFPVVGCVAYRGYFSEEAARKHAAKLDDEGLDVYVGGVTAYSTLGRFEDPVLNTMMRWSDVDLVTTLFHELAHQRVFVRDDTGFNESFATTVADIGIERWARAHPDTLDPRANDGQKALRREQRALADKARGDLEALYSSSLDEAAKRDRKRERLEQLEADARALALARGFASAGWLEGPLNNARLLSMSLYEGNEAAFRSMLEECGGDLECFYGRAEQLAALDPEARAARLAAMGEGLPAAGY